MTRIAAALVALLLGACAAQPLATPEQTPVATPVATPDETPAATLAGTPSPEPEAEPEPEPELVPEHVVAATPNSELRDELRSMMAEDQAVRTGIAPPGDDRTADELFAAWNTVDAANAERMREILDEFGWPGWSLVGEDGALAAWVLIQHADLQLGLQRRGLAMLQAAVDASDASAGDLAYLIDRVRVADGEPQVYGTQLGVDEDGELAPRTPIEDEADVDARREAAGLGTLEEYYEEFRNAGEPEPSPTGY